MTLGARLSGAIAGAFIGCCLDRSFVRHNVWGKKENPLPGLPSTATVSAEAPMTSPSPIEPRISPIPSKKSDRVGEIMRFGFPSLDTIRSRRDYVLSYDRRNRTPNWVFEHLTPESIKRHDDVDRLKSEFCEDDSIHPYFRSSNRDFKSSGYDRGHMAAASNHRLSQEDCDETFYLSNVCPQVGAGFNRDKWKHLEIHVHELVKKFKSVYVCTGPLYLPRTDSIDGKSYVKYQVIGSNSVAVPTHFFKVIVYGSPTDSRLDLESYILPNESIDYSVSLSEFMVPPNIIERASGLLFFDKVSKDRLITVNGKYL